MNINSALSNLTICDQKYAFLKKMDAKKQIQTIIKPIVGTNGYTVGIYVIGAFHNLVAGVLSPNNKQITLPQSKILNALTGQVLSHEQFKLIITSHEDAFCAIYLPETNKVYIWPHLKAEGRESHTGYIVTDKNNPFAGKSFEQIQNNLSRGTFREPCTGQTLDTTPKIHPSDKSTTYSYKDKKIDVVFVKEAPYRDGKRVEPVIL